MKKDVLLYLNDILESIALVEQYVESIGEVAFSRAKEKQDSVIHRLMIIGEAAAQVPTAVRDLVPEIQWRAIVAFRNIVIHEYSGVSMGRVWEIVKQELPILKEQIVTLRTSVSAQSKKRIGTDGKEI